MQGMFGDDTQVDRYSEICMHYLELFNEIV